MFKLIGYLPIAVENEGVFRNILRDLKLNKSKRPGGTYVPNDLDTESSLDEIFKKYSEGNRMGIFTITGFEIQGTTATIRFEDIAPLSGGGTSLKYIFKENKNVEYLKSEFTIMS